MGATYNFPVRPILLVLLAALVWPVGWARAQADPKAALLERDGFRLLDAGDARGAAEAFREALRSDSRNARVHLGLGLAAFLERRDADARQAFTQALALDPNLADARRYLGQAARRQGDLVGAIRIYETLLTRHPDHRDARDTLERWRRELSLHDRMLQAVGDRFTVSFEGPAEQGLASRALDSLDRAYWRLGDLLGAVYPLGPVPVVLYTREQFRDITRSPAWAAGAYDGIIRVPVRGALEQPDELDRVLAHEFAHALIRMLAPRGVPTWLNEGLATALETETGTHDWATVRRARAGGSMPLSMLSNGFGRFDGAEAELAYATSVIAVRRLLDEAGGYAVANLLRDLGSGAEFEAAFARRMQRSFADFVATLE
jgi:tetratricopeptide (TPR) repeat protein